MSLKIATLLLAGFFALAQAALGQSAAPVVVLQGGRVLEGVAERYGGTVIVRPINGGEIRLPATDVKFTAASLDDAYRHLRDALPLRDGDARLDLVDWCLRENLHARAADQLLAAGMEECDTNRRDRLERRLLYTVIAPQPLTVASPAQRPNEDYSALLRELSALAVEEYTVAVQPILLRHCATAGCHSAKESRFTLLRPVGQSVLPQRHTHRNLSSVATWVDRNNPQNSPLLQNARGQHGGIGAVLAEQNPLYKRLEAWATKLYLTETVPQLAIRQGSTVLRQPADYPVTQAGLETQLEETTVDPFDPEEFNRQFQAAEE